MLTLSTGALFTHLAPTAIALPSYFCLADLVLIMQCHYYNTRNKRRAAARAHLAQTGISEVSEDSPLLRRRDSSSIAGNDGSTKNTTTEREENQNSNSLVNNALSLIAVYVVGTVAWFISYKAGAWDADEPTPDTPEDVNNPLEWAGLTLGYISAVLYLW